MTLTFKKLTATLAIVLLGAMLTATANAECGNLKYAKPTIHKQSWDGANVFDPSSLLLVSSHPADVDPIVGFWQVTLKAEGNEGIPDDTIIDQGYSQWHSDNTEILNSSRAPVTQSFCLGVWKKVGSRYKLNHFAISWDETNTLVGPANIVEKVTLGAGGNFFSGSFTLDQYDTAGNNLVHIIGVVTAKRITTETPPTIAF